MSKLSWAAIIILDDIYITFCLQCLFIENKQKLTARAKLPVGNMVFTEYTWSLYVNGIANLSWKSLT